MRELINIGDKKLEVLIEGNGMPPVVILSGMGCTIDEWHYVIRALKDTTQLILPHRSGLGESEIGNEARTTSATALELNALLMALGVNEKVILVGHSYGGLCAQHFARLYPEKISGLLLVDSTSVNFKRLNELDLPTLNEQDSDEKWIEMCKRFSTMTRESIQEELKPELTEKEKEFPVEIHQRLLDFKTNSNLFKAMGSEVENWGDDADEIRKLDTFPDIPLKVIGRDAEYIVELQMKRGLPEWEVRELERVWRDLILEQAKLSNKGELVFAKDAGHAIHIDRPDVIIDSIRSLLYEQMK